MGLRCVGGGDGSDGSTSQSAAKRSELRERADVDNGGMALSKEKKASGQCCR